MADTATDLHVSSSDIPCQPSLENEVASSSLTTRTCTNGRPTYIMSMQGICDYRMAGNFCGVLIFVVDLAVMKFSHPRKLMPMVICESMMMGIATNIVAARPTLPSISKQQ